MTVDAPQLPVSPGTVVLGKYRVDEIIGVGGMGMVAQAYHLDFEEKVAIKFLLADLVSNPEAVGRFEREARVLYKIKSENVCRVIDVGKLDDGVPFMVMEFLDGYDLATLLERREPLRTASAIEYGLQACQALANAHVRGIVHRDLKPENLFIARDASGDMALKLLDFGLSKEHGEEKENRGRKLTGDQQVMGTPNYMSPEQWMASTAVTAAADQWALAAIVFEMLTGRPPFDGPQLANICSAIMNEPTPSLLQFRPDAPPGLENVLHKALEKHPHARYENIGAFAVALAAYAVRPTAVAKAERTLKMLQRAELNEEDVSGAWKDIRSPRAKSDMMATVKNPARLGQQFDLVQRMRVITSTSWQNMRLHQRSSRAAVALGIIAVVALAAAGIITLTTPGEDAGAAATQSGESTESAGSTGAEPTEHLGATPSPDTDPSSGDTAPATNTAPATDSVGERTTPSATTSSGTASSGTAPHPPSVTRPSTAPSPKIPAPRPNPKGTNTSAAKTKPPQPPKDDSQPKPEPDIFNDR